MVVDDFKIENLNLKNDNKNPSDIKNNFNTLPNQINFQE